MIRRLLAAVILFSLATGLRGETYQEWEKSVPNQTPIPFKNWLPPSIISSNVNGADYFVLQAPLGHLFGYLDFTSFPSSAFPLDVQFLYRRVELSSVSATPNGYSEHVQNWDSSIGYLARDARLGELIESRQIEIQSAEKGRSVPVWSIWAQINRDVSGRGFNAYSVLIEVTSHDGTPLLRKCLIEGVAGATTRIAGLARTNSGAEPFVGYIGSIRDLTTVDELPIEERVYRDIRVLWLDDISLRDAKYTDSFWRRVFLGGTVVFGHEADVQELAQRLGISPNQRILQGGLWSVDHPAVDFSEQLNGAVGQYNLDLKKGENPFRKSFSLGKKRTHELRRFSIWFLVSFTIFEIIIIIGSLFLLHGYRRVFRWLLIPLSAIFYTVLGVIIVHVVVDFRPEVQILQEVDSVEGWPESRVSTDVTRLGFEDGRASFSAPAFADFSWFGIDHDTTPIQSIAVNDKTVFSMRQRYGRFSGAHIDYWMPGKSPCEITANREIVATRPLRGAWVWDGRVWRDLGPMEPGKPMAIDQAHVIIDPSNISGDGMPRDSHDLYGNQDFLPEVVRQMCTKRYMASLGNTDVGILLAIDGQAAPDQMDDAAVSEIHTQTLLIHQFHLPSVKP